MNYLMHLIALFDIYVIVALSLNILVGYCGLLSLAHAGYFAVGAYTYALAVITLGWGFIESALLGMAVGVGLSVLLSLASWRFRGEFFVLIALSVQSVLYSTIYNWHKVGGPDTEFGTWANLTNGPFGIPGISKPEIAGFVFGTPETTVLLFTIVAAVVLVLSRQLLTSPWGLLLKALRDDELAARGLGKNARLAKAQAVAIACALACLAGVMYSSLINFVDPSIADLPEAILMISMVIVGGVGNSFRGPFVGALVLIAIPELLRFAELPGTLAGQLRLAVYGLALVLLMHFRPKGLAGEYRME